METVDVYSEEDFGVIELDYFPPEFFTDSLDAEEDYYLFCLYGCAKEAIEPFGPCEDCEAEWLEDHYEYLERVI